MVARDVAALGGGEFGGIIERYCGRILVGSLECESRLRCEVGSGVL